MIFEPHEPDYRPRRAQSAHKRCLDMMTKKTDWVAWILQAVVGLLVGAVVGFMLSHQRNGMPWLNSRCVKPFIAGISLFTSGLGSIYGDTMWIQMDYKIFPPEGVRAGTGGRALSASLLIAGGILSGLALITHFKG